MRMLFSGCAFFMAAIRAVALASPILPGERRVPFGLGGIGAHAIAFFADRADQHGHVFRDLGRRVIERLHGDDAAVQGRRPADARRLPGPVGGPNIIPRIGGLILADRCISGGNRLGPLHLLQRRHVVRREPSSFITWRANSRDCSAGGNVAAAARLHRGAMEEPLGRRHAHQRGHLRSAARLAVNHHPVGIAAEVGDVLLHPLQRRHQVGHADIHRILIGRSANLRHVEEAQNIQAVIDGDLHNIVMPRHLRAFVRGQFIRRAEAVAAAMEVHHDRAACRSGSASRHSA